MLTDLALCIKCLPVAYHPIQSEGDIQFYACGKDRFLTGFKETMIHDHLYRALAGLEPIPVLETESGDNSGECASDQQLSAQC